MLQMISRTLGIAIFLSLQYYTSCRLLRQTYYDTKSAPQHNSYDPMFYQSPQAQNNYQTMQNGKQQYLYSPPSSLPAPAYDTTSSPVQAPVVTQYKAPQYPSNPIGPNPYKQAQTLDYQQKKSQYQPGGSAQPQHQSTQAYTPNQPTNLYHSKAKQGNTATSHGTPASATYQISPITTSDNFRSSFPSFYSPQQSSDPKVAPQTKYSSAENVFQPKTQEQSPKEDDKLPQSYVTPVKDIHYSSPNLQTAAPTETPETYKLTPTAQHTAPIQPQAYPTQASPPSKDSYDWEGWFSPNNKTPSPQLQGPSYPPNQQPSDYKQSPPLVYEPQEQSGYNASPPTVAYQSQKQETYPKKQQAYFTGPTDSYKQEPKQLYKI